MYICWELIILSVSLVDYYYYFFWYVTIRFKALEFKNHLFLVCPTHGTYGKENGNLLQCSYLRNPTDGGGIYLGYSSWGRKTAGHDLVTKQQTMRHITLSDTYLA